MTVAASFQNVSKYYARTLPIPFVPRSEDPSQLITGVLDVTLSIEKGEIFGLIGRNGQGKTTLVKCLAGLIEPSSGTIEIFGRKANAASGEQRRMIGLVSSDERSFYWRLTGWQNLLFYSRLHGMDDATARKRIEPLLERFSLQELATRRFYGYSAGNKQRLAIVRALLNNPLLLILDEPTRSLDPIAAEELRSIVLDWQRENADRTAIITSHNLAEIESLCHRVGILSRNRLVECDSLEALRERYPAHDSVTIRIRDRGREDLWRGLRADIPSLRLVRIEEGISEVTFMQRDGELTRVLAAAVKEGHELLFCNTVRVGLREILERVDEQD